MFRSLQTNFIGLAVVAFAAAVAIFLNGCSQPSQFDGVSTHQELVIGSIQP